MWDRLSSVQKTALIVGIPTTGLVAYLLLKKLNKGKLFN